MRIVQNEDQSEATEQDSDPAAPMVVGTATAPRFHERQGFYAQTCPRCREVINWDERGRFHPATGAETCPRVSAPLDFSRAVPPSPR